MFQSVGPPTHSPAAFPPDPRARALYALKHVMHQLGARTPAELGLALKQANPATQQQVKNLLNVARGGSMTQGQAVAARVQEAGDRLQAATGIRVPTTVIDDGVANGTAIGNQNAVHTGINPDAAPGVKFHEDAHVLLGDTTNPQGTLKQRELRADQMAGQMLVKAGYGQKEIGAFINEVMRLAGGDHGSPDERAMAVIMGVNQGLAEKGLPPMG